MSKAFTKEDSQDAPLAPPKRDQAPRYCTPEGYQALQDELARLVAAPADGPEARERSFRARQLAETLERLQVVPPDPGRAGRVYFGAWVELEEEEGAQVRYRVVGPDEADAKHGRISVSSPLGAALLGKAEGDSVRVERPRGPVEYTVTRVSYRGWE